MAHRRLAIALCVSVLAPAYAAAQGSHEKKPLRSQTHWPSRPIAREMRYAEPAQAAADLRPGGLEFLRHRHRRDRDGRRGARREHRVVSGCSHFVVGRFVPRARGLVDAAAVAGARIDRSSRFSD